MGGRGGSPRLIETLDGRRIACVCFSRVVWYVHAKHDFWGGGVLVVCLLVWERKMFSEGNQRLIQRFCRGRKAPRKRKTAKHEKKQMRFPGMASSYIDFNVDSQVYFYV